VGSFDHALKGKRLVLSVMWSRPGLSTHYRRTSQGSVAQPGHPNHKQVMVQKPQAWSQGHPDSENLSKLRVVSRRSSRSSSCLGLRIWYAKASPEANPGSRTSHCFVEHQGQGTSRERNSRSRPSKEERHYESSIGSIHAQLPVRYITGVTSYDNIMQRRMPQGVASPSHTGGSEKL
jgi:hypothetical protein